MNEPTRAQVLDYLRELGDRQDWTGWSLEEIKAEIVRGDEYDGMDIWGCIVESVS